MEETEDVTPSLIKAQLAMLRALRASEDIPADVWWEATPHRIVMMTTADYEHARIRTIIRQQLEAGLAEGLDVENDVAFITAVHGERTPDLFVIDPNGRPEFRDGHFLSMQSVKLVVEVTSKATRTADLVEKPAEYASSGVPVYLVIDRKTPEVIVQHGPCGGQYSHTDRYPVGKDVPLPAPINLTLDMAFLPDYLD
ncbi:hypothetical protein GCM10023205_56770 [Yinghuangia aomiensis]|uniref:Putative restriction endonuclease domain-containing protein n=1 Tax=Yinghuangia aomiensis TaxID=676205 RepID=A0ABP9HWU4_9ACTN